MSRPDRVGRRCQHRRGSGGGQGRVDVWIANRASWAWWFLMFCLIWVGLHDSIMATRFSIHTGQPLMLLPYTSVVFVWVLTVFRSYSSCRAAVLEHCAP